MAGVRTTLIAAHCVKSALQDRILLLSELLPSTLDTHAVSVPYKREMHACTGMQVCLTKLGSGAAGVKCHDNVV